ncbi:MAG: type VI secretion system protein TssL [SAR86 cluster bacterium]|uniref:Type VI secretion system protein TssL n=1 Tax=SAR86 cluster bacterium TaxID=2030880 RepID=A0A2A5B4Z5_9GAMM|nr:MAG: type VI secretion system protein TssL [SAR86 cluster bacterium]
MSDEEVKAGAPAWMATFADLMALLMCFFVLLLSFSEMDVQKYKQVAGSMRDAFGVQNQTAATAIPMGTSIIAQEFSSGRPQPTAENVVQQQTAESMKMSLKSGEADYGEDAAARQILIGKLEQLREQTENDVAMLEEILEKEIKDDMIDIESGFRSITIRIRERGSFGSGSAALNTDFIPVMEQLRNVLVDINGRIAVEGHTDDIPISTPLTPSNWHLSSQRALSVAHELLKDGTIEDDRFMVVGYADTKPFAANTSAQDRARNRRVEIVIHQGLDDEITKELKELESADDDLLNTLGIAESELAAAN